jgi:hypothetical protein
MHIFQIAAASCTYLNFETEKCTKLTFCGSPMGDVRGDVGVIQVEGGSHIFD